MVLLENLRTPAEAGDGRQNRGRTLYINDAWCPTDPRWSPPSRVEQAAAGFLMEKTGYGSQTDRPSSLSGQGQISDKISHRNLLGKVDRLLIGGAMMFTFLKSQGKKAGRCARDKPTGARPPGARANA